MQDASLLSPTVGIVLFQLGGPETLADIEPFLKNLFEDVLPLPGFLRKPLAGFIAKKRTPKVRPLYESMGGGSPLLRNTQDQAKALELRLRELGCMAKCFICMRYAPPRVTDVMQELSQYKSIRTVIGLPLYPHHSIATTQSSVEEFLPIYAKSNGPKPIMIRDYPTESHYIAALCDVIAQAMRRAEAAHAQPPHVLFSAHGLPMSLVRKGDVYPQQIAQTLQAVVQSLPMPGGHSLAYQSRVGPVKWLEPNMDITLKTLPQQGIRNVVVVPISFVSEHVETLCELDVELKEVALHAGIEHYERVPAVGVHPQYIECLAQLVLKHVA